MNSLLQLLSQYGNILQTQLFSFLQEGVGELSEAHQRFVRILTPLQLDRFVAAQSGPGRPAASRANIARAFVAKAVLGIPLTSAFRDRLISDPVLRQLCGWKHAKDVPRKWTLSRAFAEFARTELPQRVHAAVVEQAYEDLLVGHVSRDATAIEVREKAQPKASAPAKPSRKKNRKPEEMSRIERQSLSGTSLADMLEELPRACDKGCKTNSKGSKQWWVGYKLHMDVADGAVPLSCILTSASLHDSQAAIPLARMTAERVTSLYDLMDRGYESQHIEAYSRSLGHVPIIDRQKRAGAEHPVMAPHEQVRFRQRTTVERVNSAIKEVWRAIRARARPRKGNGPPDVRRAGADDGPTLENPSVGSAAGKSVGGRKEEGLQLSERAGEAEPCLAGRPKPANAREKADQRTIQRPKTIHHDYMGFSQRARSSNIATPSDVRTGH